MGWVVHWPCLQGRIMGARSWDGQDRLASQACHRIALMCGRRWDTSLVFMVAWECF